MNKKPTKDVNNTHKCKTPFCLIPSSKRMPINGKKLLEYGDKTDIRACLQCINMFKKINTPETIDHKKRLINSCNQELARLKKFKLFLTNPGEDDQEPENEEEETDREDVETDQEEGETDQEEGETDQEEGETDHEEVENHQTETHQEERDMETDRAESDLENRLINDERFESETQGDIDANINIQPRIYNFRPRKNQNRHGTSSKS